MTEFSVEKMCKIITFEMERRIAREVFLGLVKRSIEDLWYIPKYTLEKIINGIDRKYKLTDLEFEEFLSFVFEVVRSLMDTLHDMGALKQTVFVDPWIIEKVDVAVILNATDNGRRLLKVLRMTELVPWRWCYAKEETT